MPLGTATGIHVDYFTTVYAQTTVYTFSGEISGYYIYVWVRETKRFKASRS